MTPQPLLIDFWSHNPFKELELAFPPVPSGNEIGTKGMAKTAPIRARLRKLAGDHSPEAVAETKDLEAQKHHLDDVRKQLIKRANEMRATLPFDTLLSVQAPVPRVFVDAAARSATASEAWWELIAGQGHSALSDTDRRDFAADIRRQPLLDDVTPDAGVPLDGREGQADERRSP